MTISVLSGQNGPTFGLTTPIFHSTTILIIQPTFVSKYARRTNSVRQPNEKAQQQKHSQNNRSFHSDVRRSFISRISTVAKTKMVKENDVRAIFFNNVSSSFPCVFHASKSTMDVRRTSKEEIMKHLFRISRSHQCGRRSVERLCVQRQIHFDLVTMFVRQQHTYALIMQFYISDLCHFHCRLAIWSSHFFRSLYDLH